MPKTTVIYCGTPALSVNPLKALLNDKRFEVLAIITQEDKTGGRGQKLISPPVKAFAEMNKLIVHQPEKIKNIAQEIMTLEPDFLVVFAYGKILPEEILKIPKFGCVNIHLSLLPKYRGASPIQEALLQGDAKTGMTLMLMDKTLDTGHIIFQKEIPIESTDNQATLLEKLSHLSASILPELLIDFQNGKINPRPQQSDSATYCRKIKKEDGFLDFKKETAEEMLRKIRAFTPWPGCYFFTKGKRIKILRAATSEQKNSSEKVALETKKGYLLPLQVQLEGKKEMEISEFLRGSQQIFE